MGVVESMQKQPAAALGHEAAAIVPGPSPAVGPIDALTPATMLSLQATAGNAAVCRWLARQTFTGGLSPGVDSAAFVQRRDNVGTVVRNFIARADGYGLPVRFLRRVQRDYTIATAIFGDDHVNPVLNSLVLTDDTVSGLRSAAPALPLGEATAIQTLYHEATHAYLDLISDEADAAAQIASGTRHYQGAPTTSGRATSDPGRVFQEAAAEYVGHRVATWWMAFEMLSILAASGHLTPERRAEVGADYDRGMRDRVFGYSEEGGFLGIGNEQEETTRPMTGGLKAFLDQNVLEGRIPEQFAAVSGFQAIANRPAP